MADQDLLDKLDKIADRLWWIAAWLFVIAVNSCEIGDKITNIAGK
jgi:hypothetical protein